MLLENMFMALHAIKANKMRSFLTMLGIIIWIGSVIAIVSIGDTMRSMVADLYANVGMTRAIIYIWPSDGGDMRDSDYFNLEQMERIKEVFHDDIEYMDTNAYYSSEALFGRKKVKFQFQGIDYNYPDVQKINILYGRNLNEADIKGRKKNVVLEVQGALELFGTENAVGKTLRTTVYGETDDYNVVGVYKKEMTPFEAMMMSMMPGQTKEGFIPYTILSWPNDYLYQLNFYAKEGTDMNELSGRMVPYLARLKDRQPADVTFYSALDEMKGNDSMMSSLSAAVGGIAAISLLVGGIGIMNIMYVSVTERTREIGLRMSIGAKGRHILFQFLIESIIISVSGGVIGVGLGIGVSLILSSLLGWPVSVLLYSVIISFLVCTFTGVFFGWYPARKASRLNPIDAIRYEERR